jgi:hypothetical protein
LGYHPTSVIAFYRDKIAYFAAFIETAAKPSLRPLKFKEAVADLLKVKPPEPPKKKLARQVRRRIRAHRIPGVFVRADTHAFVDYVFGFDPEKDRGSAQPLCFFH